MLTRQKKKKLEHAGLKESLSLTLKISKKSLDNSTMVAIIVHLANPSKSSFVSTFHNLDYLFKIKD